MSKELEALQRITEHLELDSDYFYTQEKVDEDTIKQSLKALEIIKEKKVNTLLVMNVRDYNEYCRYMASSFEYEPLTQEEYDLLKEILL